MNKKQLAVWLKLSNEDLKLIGQSGVAEHRDVIMGYLDGNDIEYKENSGFWAQVGTPSFYIETRYRVKRHPLIINGVDVPRGIIEAPAIGVECYSPYPYLVKGYTLFPWRGDGNDQYALNSGLLYTNEEDIKKLVAALRS